MSLLPWIVAATTMATASVIVVLLLNDLGDSSRTAGQVGELRYYAERMRTMASVSEQDAIHRLSQDRTSHIEQLRPGLNEALGPAQAEEALSELSAALQTLDAAALAGDSITADTAARSAVSEVNLILEEIARVRGTAVERGNHLALGGIVLGMVGALVTVSSGFLGSSRERKITLKMADDSQCIDRLINHSPSVAVLSVDADGVIVDVRSAPGSGVMPSWIGLNLYKLTGADEVAFEGVRSALIDRKELSRQFISKSRVYQIDCYPTSLISRGRGDGLEAIISDVTEQVHFNRQIRYAFNGMVGVIGKLTDLADPYTQGHEEAVADIAEAIARSLDLEERAVEGLRVAARLHDTGKITIPSVLLSRPGRLQPAEFELIKTHVENARRIFEDVRFPWPEIQAIYEHHERLDGSGYPLGLAGDEISLAGRILAVADVCDAITSHRPYRPARSRADLIDELRSGRRSRYDARIVDITIALIEADNLPFRQSLGADRHGEVLSGAST